MLLLNATSTKDAPAMSISIKIVLDGARFRVIFWIKNPATKLPKAKYTSLLAYTSAPEASCLSMKMGSVNCFSTSSTTKMEYVANPNTSSSLFIKRNRQPRLKRSVIRSISIGSGLTSTYLINGMMHAAKA